MHVSRESVSMRAMLEERKIPVLTILAIAAVGVCVISPLTESYAYLLAPVIGLVTIAYSIIVRSVGGALLGLLELFLPLALFLVVSYMIAWGM